MLPDDIITHILSYVSYFDLDEYFKILQLDINKQQKTKQLIYNRRLTKTHTKNCVRYVIEGKLHNSDGPAIEYDYGLKEWYQNGKLHNTNGPAIEYADGSKDWFINGTRVLSF